MTYSPTVTNRTLLHRESRNINTFPQTSIHRWKNPTTYNAIAILSQSHWYKCFKATTPRYLTRSLMHLQTVELHHTTENISTQPTCKRKTFWTKQLVCLELYVTSLFENLLSGQEAPRPLLSSLDQWIFFRYCGGKCCYLGSLLFCLMYFIASFTIQHFCEKLLPSNSKITFHVPACVTGVCPFIVVGSHFRRTFFYLQILKVTVVEGRIGFVKVANEIAVDEGLNLPWYWSSRTSIK